VILRCIAARVVGSRHHKNITHYYWIPSEDQGVGPKPQTREKMVAFIEKGGKAYVQDDDGRVSDLRVRVSAQGFKYCQGWTNGAWTDDLLELPRM
jgi:hypothetical protein